MATRYAWQGPRPTGIDAQIAGEHIERLVAKHDEYLTAEEIVADARNAQSPLHKAFKWDDSEAADANRLDTARRVLVGLVVKTKERRKTRAFVFVHVPKHSRKCYVPVRSAMAQPDLKQQVIEQAYKNLERWIANYGGSRALREVRKDVERLRRSIERQYLSAAGII